MKRLTFILLIFSLLLFACEPLKTPKDGESANLIKKTKKSTDDVEFVKKPEMGSTFILRMQEGEDEVYLPGNVAVKVVAIKDTRCPEGAQCVTPGKAQVVLEIDFVGADPIEETLTLGGDPIEEPAFVVYYGTYITLVSVEPKPTLEGNLRSEDLTVTLAVSKNAIQ